MKRLTLEELDYCIKLDCIQNNELTKVDFSGTDSFDEIKGYIKVLIKNYSVESFTIDFRYMNIAKARLIMSFLEQRKDVNEIKIYGLFENISENNNQELHSEILKIYTKLINCGLEINEFPIVFSKMKFMEVPNILPKLSLRKLNLLCNEIGDDNISIILESPILSKLLESINLKGNKLTDEVTLYIKQFLKDSNSIQKLNLSKNELTNKGLEHLKEGLLVNQSLTKLNLSHNKINHNELSYKRITDSARACLEINSYIQNILLRQKDINNASKDEKYAIEIYQKNPNCIEGFITQSESKFAMNATAKYIAEHIEEAIQLQQLEKIFELSSLPLYLLRLSDISFNILFEMYIKAGGYTITELGDHSFDMSDQQYYEISGNNAPYFHFNVGDMYGELIHI